MDNSTIKVSVLCTAYNHGAYLRRTLESFVGQQTDFPFEILVNDDCSTDDSARILREFAERYPERIRPFYQPVNLYSQGVNLYEQVLYPNARGQYFAVCEGDDCWTDPNKLQLQADFLDAHPDYSACVHNTVGEYLDHSRPDGPLFPQTGDRDIPFSLVIRGMSLSFHTSSVMARREVLLSLPDFRDVGHSYGFTDYSAALWMTMNGRVRFLDRCMSAYRIGSNASAWSTGVGKNYKKLLRFVRGEIAVLDALLPHVQGDEAQQVRAVRREREYELLYLTGDAGAMLRPPYREIWRTKPLSHRVTTVLKAAFPGLHRLYRRKKGFTEGEG